MSRFDCWHIEIFSEYGRVTGTEELWTLNSWSWEPGGDNTHNAERIARDYAEAETEVHEHLLDHRKHLRSHTWRLSVRPHDLPDEPPVRVMVTVEAVIQGNGTTTFSEKDWCRE